MQNNPSDDFMGLPLEDDIFDWQFAIRGPSDTEFEGGIYHGRIQLPAEYPFKPPSFTLLTPNGRFETQTKICLSISNYHPEHWQPSWSVRTALVALIAFMPTEPGGALGSLDQTKEEKRALAIKSREAAPMFGTPERQMLIDEIHQYMLSKAPPIPEPPLQMPEEQSINGQGEPSIVNNQHDGAPAEVGELAAVPEENDRIVEDVREVNLNADAGPIRFRVSIKVRQRRRVPVNRDEQLHRPGGRQLGVFIDRILTLHRRGTRQVGAFVDRILTFAAIGLTLAIAVLLLKKFLKANSYSLGVVDGL